MPLSFPINPRAPLRALGFLLFYVFNLPLIQAAETQSKVVPLSETAHYVGGNHCAGCHATEAAQWQGSHHDKAMQEASPQTVLGNFNDVTFTYSGITSTFFKQGDTFKVRTDGPEGKLKDYSIAYTFGFTPLQQYLIPLENGRLQALSIAWDARPAKEGGQRWFHLYPDESIQAGDELHWTGPNQNWNFMCADCHSTHLEKNYNREKDAYATQWSDIDVSCEACHGPGSRHVAWANTKAPKSADNGLSVGLNERKGVTWRVNPQTGNATRRPQKTTDTEIETCAFCHARRTTVFPDTRPGQPLLDNLQVALLTEPLYHADGQIKDEVFEYGSFLQSKMYHAGVTCSDCHQPHSLKLRAEGNGLCAQCHLPDKYENKTHHLHTQGSEGSQCVNCHMPAKNYMVVDPRRDHSLRIPRPDLSLKLDTPNACNQCHADKTAAWAADILQTQFGAPKPHYGEALYAGRNGLGNAIARLAELTVDPTKPAIARATAASLLAPYLSRETAPILQMSANDPQPLIGYGLATALDQLPPAQRMPFAYPLLFDASRVTRSLAARSVAGPASQSLPAEGQARFEEALDDYQRSQQFNADRPEGLSNLATLFMQQGDIDNARRLYRLAIAQAPYYTPAYVNLADSYRQTANEGEGRKVLEDALGTVREKAPIHHALGLWYVRQKNMTEALKHLQDAAESPAATDQYLYVYGVALNSSGQTSEALRVLEDGHNRHPGNLSILYALISIHQAAGQGEAVQKYEAAVRALSGG